MCIRDRSDDKRFLFVHIGGGVRLQEVREYKEEYGLDNVMILPYQPRERIHLSLGSADIQVVSLGEGCVGYTLSLIHISTHDPPQQSDRICYL